MAGAQTYEDVLGHAFGPPGRAVALVSMARYTVPMGLGDGNFQALLTGQVFAIRAKTEVFRPLVLTVDEFNLIRYIAWFLLPAAMAAGAVLAWWRRR